MAFVPTYDEALALVKEYNQEPFHILHAETVSFVCAWFARTLDPGREDYWAVVGLLHDLDFERYPERHCVAVRELLEPKGIDPKLIDAVVSHGWGMTGGNVEPSSMMEKALFATDELTGLIGAAVKMRPSGSASDLEVKSLMKKYKSPAFAAGVSREAIAKGAEMLGWPLEVLMENTIEALRAFEVR